MFGEAIRTTDLFAKGGTFRLALSVGTVTIGSNVINFTQSGAFFKLQQIPSIKIDHNFGDNIKISGYWSRQLSSNPNHNGLDEVLTSVTPQADRSTTVRLNYDQTLTPTTLLHLGAGLLYTTQAVIPQRYDPATLGLIGYDTGAFPNFTGLSDATTGGNGIGIGVGAFGNYKQYEAKPTFNANLTLVQIGRAHV